MPSVIPKLVLCLLLALSIASCGRSNPTAVNSDETNVINFEEDKLPLSDSEYIYRQSVQMNLPMPDEKQYSFRLSTLSGDLPEGFESDSDGWLIFGQAAQIWTSSPTLWFDFTSQNGRIENLITGVEVRVKAKDGSITLHESAFRSKRLISSRISVSFAEGATVGTGVEFGLQELSGDVFVSGMYAHHFMYRVNITDEAGTILTEGTWHSSLQSPDIRLVQLSSTSTPAITPNAGTEYTQFESYVVSRSGIMEATTHSIRFKVVGTNRPVAKVFSTKTGALGSYHYSIYPEGSMMYYNPLISSGERYRNRELWNTPTGYEAINSSDFRLHLEWGYSGQYGINYYGNTSYLDDPWLSELKVTLNEDGVPYYSRIVAYDLSLDNAPFPVMSHFIYPQVVSHQDGSQWLRVQNFNSEASHATISNLADGFHSFKVCAIDLQAVISEPAVYDFRLLPYIAPAQRSGILIVDDSTPNATYAPEAILDTFYTNVVPTNWGMVDQYDCYQNSNYPYLSPGMLQNYRAVLYYNDNGSNSGNLDRQVNAFDMYLANSGSLVISGTRRLALNLSEIYANASVDNPSFLQERFGIQDMNSIGVLSNSYVTNPFFVHAIDLHGNSDIPVNLTSPFAPSVSTHQGLSAITYFNPAPNMDFSYAFGCKPVNYPTYPPTQEQYNLYSSKYVAYRYQNNGSHVAMFGFPLSYMEQAAVQDALSSLFTHMLGSSTAKGSKK